MPSNRSRSAAISVTGRDRSLDETDLRILRELAADPRAPLLRLAGRVGLSRPAVGERVRRLERAGVIRGWRIELDPKALGFEYTVFVRVRPGAGQVTTLEALLRSLPSVVECYRTTGDDSFLVKAVFATVPEFEEFFARIQRYGQASASDVLSAVVPARTVPLLDPRP